MSYERVELTINTPIEGLVGCTPDGIELKGNDGVYTELWVGIGEDVENEIERSERFKQLLADTEARLKNAGRSEKVNVSEVLFTAVKEYAIRRAQNYLSRLNFMRGSHKYEILDCSLITLLPTGQIQRGREKVYGMVTTIGNEFKLDISKTYDEDDFLNKLYYNYDLGMKAQQENDLVSAYKYFYDLLPLRRTSPYKITKIDAVNLDLKIIRDGMSHDILTKTDLVRAKSLFGDDYVLQDGASGNCYAYFNSLNPHHMELIRNNIHHVKNAAKEYIDTYTISSGVAP